MPFDRQRAEARLLQIGDIAETRNLTRKESDEFDRLEKQCDRYDKHGPLAAEEIEDRKVRVGATNSRIPEIQGTPNEVLSRGQSMVEWTRRAAENGVHVSGCGKEKRPPKPVRYMDNERLNEYWGQKLGFSSRSDELRALGEDTVGSGNAIVPQTWTASFIDYLYANTIAGPLGVSRVPMSTEQVNVPQFTSPVAPAWLAENSTIGIDASPAFSTVQLNAGGGWKDITLYSMELAQDAYIQGGLPGMLAESMARKFALAVDLAMIYGISSTSAVAPGLINETGFNVRYFTGASDDTAAAPVDTQDFSIVLEKIRNVPDEPTMGVLCNPSVAGTFSRLNASTYAKYWDWSPDVVEAGLDRFITTTQLTDTETVPATAVNPATTGGSYSSYFMGPWHRIMLGVHLDLNTSVLRERYIDMAQIGLWGWFRGSIRTGHPESFYRTIGIETT
jgi:HK97 family phage major capsid protein